MSRCKYRSGFAPGTSTPGAGTCWSQANCCRVLTDLPQTRKYLLYQRAREFVAELYRNGLPFFPYEIGLLFSNLHILLGKSLPRAKTEQGINRVVSGNSIPDGIPEQGIYLDLSQGRKSVLLSLVVRPDDDRRNHDAEPCLNVVSTPCRSADGT